MRRALLCKTLPLTVWGRDVIYSASVTKSQVARTMAWSTCSQPAWPIQVQSAWHPFPQAEKWELMCRKSRLLHRSRLSVEGRERLLCLAPRVCSISDDPEIEFDIDYAYVQDLETWRLQLHAGTVTTQELLAFDPWFDLLPYLLLLRDWRAIAQFCAGLVQRDSSLALLFRRAVLAVRLADLRRFLAQYPACSPPLLFYIRPRPPTAALAPPMLPGLVFRQVPCAA